MAITNDVPVIGYTDATADYHDTVPGPAKVDGRKLRSAKTKADLLQACRACLQSGDFRPTGAALARVAGVSVRTVFDHYATVDELCRAALDQQTRDAIRDLILRDCPPISGADADRLVSAVVFGTG